MTGVFGTAVRDAIGCQRIIGVTGRQRFFRIGAVTGGAQGSYGPKGGEFCEYGSIL